MTRKVRLTAVAGPESKSLSNANKSRLSEEPPRTGEETLQDKALCNRLCNRQQGRGEGGARPPTTRLVKSWKQNAHKNTQKKKKKRNGRRWTWCSNSQRHKVGWPKTLGQKRTKKKRQIMYMSVGNMKIILPWMIIMLLAFHPPLCSG